VHFGARQLAARRKAIVIQQHIEDKAVFGYAAATTITR
jgi:hypothetical protein